MKYLKVHYVDFFAKLGQQIANNYPNSESPRLKNYNLFQFGKSLMTHNSISDEKYLLLFKLDFTKGPLQNGYSKFEYLSLYKEEFAKHIDSAFGFKHKYSFKNLYLMEDLSAKTEYYTLEFKQVY